MSFSLGEFIAALEACPQDFVSPIGIREPHSFRGSYDELAFEPAPPMPVGDMLVTARSALGQTFGGYKGGDFTMDEWSPVHLSFYGHSTDYWAIAAVCPPDVVRAKMQADDGWAYENAFGEAMTLTPARTEPWTGVDQ